MGKDKNVLYLGNLRRDLPLTDLKYNLLELFCNYIGVDVQWDDIDIKKGKQAWFAFIDLHDEGEASETLEELASWENRRNLRYNFTYIVPPYESLAVDYKKIKKYKKSKKPKEESESTEGGSSDKMHSANNNAQSVDTKAKDQGHAKPAKSGGKAQNEDSKMEVGDKGRTKTASGKGSDQKDGKSSKREVGVKKVEKASSPNDGGQKSASNGPGCDAGSVATASVGGTLTATVGELSLEDKCSASTSTTGCPVTRAPMATSTTGLVGVAQLPAATSTTGLVGATSRQYTLSQFLGTETRNREYKLGSGNYVRKQLHRDVGKYVCGFLNSGEGGTLLVGVSDSGNVTGVECGQAQEDEARLSIDMAIKTINPAIFPDMYSVQFIPVVNNASPETPVCVIEVSVNPLEDRDVLYATCGDVYVRRDGSVQGPLKGAEIQDWTRKRHQREIHQLRETVRQQEERLLLQERRQQSKVCALL